VRLHQIAYRYLQKADKMPKLSETFVRKIAPSKSGTQKYWDTEIKGLVLFVGKQSRTWYFQKDVGGQTKRVMIGRYPMISSQSARQTAMGLALEMRRGAGRAAQVGAPKLSVALESYLARPKLRSEIHKKGIRQQFDLCARPSQLAPTSIASINPGSSIEPRPPSSQRQKLR